MVVHNAAAESLPWRGTTLAVRVARFLSVLMGACTVALTYWIGREVFPDKRWLALAGAAVVAFTPMFLFISGSVNNDNLSVLLSTLTIWILLRRARAADQSQATLSWTIALGVTLGLAALSKQSALGLFILSGLVIAFCAWRRRRWQPFVVEGALVVLIAALIAGWWYYRNWDLYQDITGLNVFLDIVGRRSPPASLAQLWGERVGFVQSYWGLFGGVNIPMPDAVYGYLNILASIGAVGTSVYLVKRSRSAHGLGSDWLPVAVTLLWIPCVVIPLVAGWTRFTIASQGRLIFPAISSISLWLVAGLAGWLAERWSKIVAAAAALSMALIAVNAPILWIAPRYQAPLTPAKKSGEKIADFSPPGEKRPEFRLTSAKVLTNSTRPGGAISVEMEWESVARANRNWSIFVHAQDSLGIIIAQRDLYPGQGLIATSDLAPDLAWTDRLVIPISDSTYAPEQIQIIAGLYDLTTGERMTVNGATDSIVLGSVQLEPAMSFGNIPNPVTIDWGHELTLSGYDLTSRAAKPGETITLTTYWSTQREVSRDYTLSAQLLDDQLNKVGQADAQLLHDGNGTSKWKPTVITPFVTELVIAEDARPMTYNLRLIVYWLDAQGVIQRLQRVIGDQTLDPFVDLTPIKALP